MRVHVIGLGGAGGRIIDRLAADSDGDRFLQGLNAFDTDAAALDALRSIDESRRYRFGDAAGGGGLDGDLHAARRLGDAHASELGRAIDDQQPSLAEAFVLVVGLGGGAGAGVAPALAEELTRLYDVPIYAVGLLPTPAESEPDEPGKADSPRTAGDDDSRIALQSVPSRRRTRRGPSMRSRTAVRRSFHSITTTGSVPVKRSSTPATG